MVQMKRCSSCKEEFPATKEFFHGCKGKKFDLHQWCKPCRKIKSKVNRRKQVAKIYGITEDDFNFMLYEQGGVCAICGKKETAKSTTGEVRQLCIEHDHVTGKIRGITCSDCNIGLSKFHDNTDFLAEAIKYLEKQK